MALPSGFLFGNGIGHHGNRRRVRLAIHKAEGCIPFFSNHAVTAVFIIKVMAEGHKAVTMVWRAGGDHRVAIAVVINLPILNSHLPIFFRHPAQQLAIKR